MSSTIPPIPNWFFDRFCPCAIVIDCTSEAIVGQQDVINKWLHDYFVEVQGMSERTRFFFDTFIISVADTVKVLGPFCPSDHFSPLPLHHGNGASLENAVEIALDLLEERKQTYRKLGITYKDPKLYLLSADVVNFCFHLNDPAKRLHCMLKDKRIKIYPIICLPQFLLSTCDWFFSDAAFPTLQSPLEKVLSSIEYSWATPMEECPQDEDDQSLLLPPSLLSIDL